MNPLKLIGPRTLTALVVLVALDLLAAYAGDYGWWTVNEQSARYGWRMLPDQTGRSRNLEVLEQINSAGFRDREWAPPVQVGVGPDGEPLWAKDESVFRVCLVGNSMTFGTSVSIEQTWGRVLEQQLRAEFAARGDPRTPLVMNFAVQGFVYEQMSRIYEDFIRPYRPDLMIVPTHPHDIMPMTPSADDADYDLRTLVLRTALHDWVHKRMVNRWIPKVPASPEARQVARRFSELDAQLSERPFARDFLPYWDAMIRGRERQLGPDGELEQEAMLGLVQMAEQVAADGGRLVLLSLPRWRQCFEPGLMSTASRWEPLAASRPDLNHVDPMADFLPPMQPVVTELQAAQGRRWLDEASARQLGDRFWLTDDLTSQVWTDAAGVEHPGTELASADATLFFLDDVGHYSPKGHALLGQSLFRALQAQGLLGN